MNFVSLKQDYENIICAINNEKLSNFNDITNLLRGNLPKFVNSILIKFDEEIQDDYCISFEGHSLIYKLLCSKKKMSSYCKEITFSNIYSHDLTEKNKVLIEIAKKYIHIDKYLSNTNKVYNESRLYLPEKYINTTDSELIISNTFNHNYKYNVQIGNNLSIEEKNVWIFVVPENMVEEVLEYYSSLKINECIKQIELELKKCQIAEIDKKLLEYINTKEVQYYLSDIKNSIEYGEKNKFVFCSFPENYYRLSFSEGLIVTDNTYKGIKEGQLSISVVDKNNDIVFIKEINCIKHKYLTEIRILTDLTDLIKHEKKKLEVIYIPDDADDIEEVKFEVDNPQIAMITQYNEIMPLQPGSSFLKVTGKKVSTQTAIVVKNNVEYYEFEQQTYTLAPGEIKIIPLKFREESVKTEQLQWSFNNPNIAYIRPSIKHDCCQIVASKEMEGNGTIRCYNPVTQMNKYCNIIVTRPPKSNFATWTIFLIIILLLLFCCSSITY